MAVILKTKDIPVTFSGCDLNNAVCYTINHLKGSSLL